MSAKLAASDKRIPITKQRATRRAPITRTEGETRFIQAATSLLRSRPYPTVSVREIAQLADVNQGFIHTWFGSQKGLYLRVAQELFQSMVDVIHSQPANAIALNPLDDEVRFAVRLLFWLDLEGVDTSPVKPQLDTLTSAFTKRMIEQIGIDEPTAEALTMQASAIGFGAAAFAHLIGFDEPTKFFAAVGVWRRQLELLAADSANRHNT